MAAVAFVDPRRRVACAELVAELDAGHVWHRHVGHDDVHRFAVEQLEACGRGIDTERREVVRAEELGHQDCRVMIVIHDKNATSHHHRHSFRSPLTPGKTDEQARSCDKRART
jgi:hypothetical protein